MKNRKLFSKVFACLMIIAMVFAIAPVSAFADDIVTPDAPILNDSTQQENVLQGNMTDIGIEDVGSALPVTTTDDILNWATTKGNEIIYMLQIFCQPFAILIFIVAAFMTLIGCIGKGDLVGKGVWGMVISVVVYAAVLYAPVILQTFVGWVAS